MILQALYEYYQRKAALPDSQIAPEGWQKKEIPYIIVLDADGRFITIEDTREGEGKNIRTKQFLVPAEVKKTSGIKANLLWGNVEYVFGIITPKNEKEAKTKNKIDKEKLRVVEKQKAFLETLRQSFPDERSKTIINPVLIFLENDPVSKIMENESIKDTWVQAFENNANLTFRIVESENIICKSLEYAIIQLTSENESDVEGICLITGEQKPIARLHPSIKGVYNAHPSGANIVSFNLDSFGSYGKKQNFNAPVSESAAIAYTTALNELLGKDSRNKVQIGDTTTIFWSQKKDEIEDIFPCLLSSQDDPDAEIRAVEQLYKRVYTGAQRSESKNKFYILGLVPNKVRLSIRFWHQGSIPEFEMKIKQHFDDIEIVRSENDVGKYALFWILSAMTQEKKVDNSPSGFGKPEYKQGTIAQKNKIDNLPPNLAGAIVQSVMNGTPYPVTMLNQTIRRIRATQKITRIQAGILKAYLNRYYRTHQTNEEEIKVSLDTNNMNVGYRLGRLFAVLEKIQEDVNPGLNTTIRDHYYGAASSTPVTVYPQLLKLKNYHLAKLSNPGRKIWYENILGEIFNGIGNDIPSHLSMEDQARFAIGYYHQRQDLFTKKEKIETNENCEE
ncbi:hypothetical protein MmiAt1_11300 [Methanimicrococcus sp. At1]|uniref:Type I-C CRISPR-associated protein Cas8c/Csd1 n=1 Tax=Methanimicrococcus hacksteinii TaxID=3028293 RepID=A0ABU3VQ61_9EURY|nr:type I-C CRISPR-associated protein Cas8c/Csd1 [Methanimicrococcus sp. At1]MDV0445547.1 hypothetical protein [Methanimicrococcus sp. At1]